MLAQFTFILNIWTFSFSSGTLFSAKPQSTNNETAKKRNRKKNWSKKLQKKAERAFHLLHKLLLFSYIETNNIFFIFTKINIRSDSVYLAALHFTVVFHEKKFSINIKRKPASAVQGSIEFR